MVEEARLVSSGLTINIDEQDASPQDAWLSKPVAENITEAMDNAPLGALYEIVYAVLAQRLKSVLDANSPLSQLLSKTLVQTVQFRAVNPSYSAQAQAQPVAQGNRGAGSGSYHSKLWGPSPDERLPSTAPADTPELAYAMGQDPGTEPNKGLLISKLFADLKQHLPLVLFNITAKNYIPIGIGGSSVGKRFWQNGKVISEIVYRAQISVEALAITSDDDATSRLQAIVEACFGPLRDQIGTGSSVNGRSWQLTLPTRLTPSGISEVEAPWSMGDDKGAKLYTAVVGLEDMSFECVTYVAKPVALALSLDPDAGGSGQTPSIALASETGDLTQPMRLRLGQPQRLVITGMPVTADLAVSQSKRVIEVRKPNQGGVYEVIPRRTGEAILRVYDTHMTVSAQLPDTPVGKTESPLFERKVIVTAV